MLRVLVGERTDGCRDRSGSSSLECEIDDMNPQIFGPLMDRLYAAGALDVFYAPVQMKKNRPGTLRDRASRRPSGARGADRRRVPRDDDDRRALSARCDARVPRSRDA